MFNNEEDIINYLKEIRNWKIHFAKFKLLGFNIPVYGCISKSKIGLVDIGFKWKSWKYLIEVKFDKRNPSGDFWESLKILGYCQTDNLYHTNENTKPVVMLRKEILNYDYRVILYTLKIGWIAFTIREDNIITFEINLL